MGLTEYGALSPASTPKMDRFTIHFRDNGIGGDAEQTRTSTPQHEPWKHATMLDGYDWQQVR